MIQLRPSGSPIWTNCAANPKFSAASQFVEEESDAAREGTCAAWVADSVLKGDAASCADMLGETHTNGWLVTDDMVVHVQRYVDAVRKRGVAVNAEQKVHLTDTIAGTFDSSTVSHSGDTLYVDDLKYGYVIVEPESPQLAIYGAGELKRLNNPAIRFVVLSIFQPRAWHPDGVHRSVRMTVEELNAKAQWIVERGELCQAPEPVATPGSHCTYCKAGSECAASAQTVYKMYERVESTRQGRMSPEEMVNELDFLDRCEKLLKARKTAVEAEADQRVRGNEVFTGWGLKDRHGHRKFTVPLPIVQAMTGIAAHKQVPRTPAEMESEGANPDIINKISVAPVVGRKLGRITQKDISRMFEK